MRRVLFALLAALGLVALAAALDWFAFSEDFGLWTYTLGTIGGLGLVLAGLLISIGTLLTARKKWPGLALGGQIIFTGLLAFAWPSSSGLPPVSGAEQKPPRPRLFPAAAARAGRISPARPRITTRPVIAWVLPMLMMATRLASGTSQQTGATSGWNHHQEVRTRAQRQAY